MRIIALIQDANSAKETMQAKGITDFDAPPSMPKLIDAAETVDESRPQYLSQKMS
jgi:hypothetical protein